MKKAILLPLILLNVLSLQSFAQYVDAFAGLFPMDKKLQAICDNPVFDEAIAKAESENIWKDIVAYLRSYRTDKTFAYNFSLGESKSLAFGKTSISENSVGQKYSGIDKWNINLSAYFPGMKQVLGSTLNREITFIQQFDSKCKSIVRSAYDPITKIPMTADSALKNLKPGDFVALSAPLVISLGKGAEQFFNMAKIVGKLSASATVFASGEFDVHIFRMDNNFVRVRFFDSKSQGAKAQAGFKLFELKVSNFEIIKLVPLDVSFSRSTTNLFSSDYVFNLNNAESRNLYDQLMGQKLNSVNAVAESVTNLIASDNQLSENAFIDLAAVDRIAAVDKTVDVQARRVVRLFKGENSTNSTSFAISSNFTKYLKLENNHTSASTKLSTFNADDKNKKYKITAFTTQSNLKVFQLWGCKDLNSRAFLAEADANYNPIEANGLQSIQLKEYLRFSKEDLERLQKRIQYTMPTVVVKHLKYPDLQMLSKFGAESRFEETLFIDLKHMDKLPAVSSEKVRREIVNIFESWGWIKTQAQSSPEASESELDKYKSQINTIVSDMTNLFNASVPMEKRIASYSNLQGNPLFHEIGTTLMLRIIPEQEIEKSVLYKLVISGHGFEPVVSKYPPQDDMEETNIFNRILSNNMFLVDRSFNLRYYLTEKGNPLSLSEALEHSK